MRRIVTSLIIFSIFSIHAVAQDEVKAEPKKKLKTEIRKAKGAAISFKNDVFPLVKKNCLPCHSEEQMNPSELYMDSYDGIIAGGKHGKPIVPGKAKESPMIQKLGETPPFGDRMPLKAKQPLSDEEIKILIDWINQGAKKN